MLERHVSANCFCPLLLLPYHHTDRQAFKLSTQWQPRTPAVAQQACADQQLIFVFWHCIACVLLCVLLYVCVCAVGACTCVIEPHIYIFFTAFVTISVYSALLMLLPYHVCVIPCLEFSSSPRCSSHGTAVAEQVCVDRLYACVGIAYACVICVWYDT